MNSVLELAEAFDAMAQKEGSGTVSAYWAAAFQCEDGSPDLFVAVAALHAKLLKAIQVFTAADTGERAKGLYIQSALALQPFVMGSQISHMDKTEIIRQRQNIDVLFLAGEAYPNEAAPDINPITLQTLEKELSELIDEVRKSDMPMQLRHSVETQLNTLLLAVRGYAILGQEGFARVSGPALLSKRDSRQRHGTSKLSLQNLVMLVRRICMVLKRAVAFNSSRIGLVWTQIAEMLRLTETPPRVCR